MRGGRRWATVTGEIPAEAEARLAERLEELPVLGCEVADAGGGRVRVTAYLALGEEEAAAAVEAALEALGCAGTRRGWQMERDWLAEYRRRVRPFPVGRRWWIDPHPDRPTPAPPDRIRLVLPPREAFGSGSHESTRLALMLLEAVPVAGRTVLDVGTGSGVLAFAAGALGAAWIAGLDVDPRAVAVAREGAALQEPPRRPALLVGEPAAVEGAFDLVLCNMVSGILLPLLPELRRLLADGGDLLLSGLLVAERDRVRDELGVAGLAPAGELELGEWLGVRARRA